jgi:hypothetical protein
MADSVTSGGMPYLIRHETARFKLALALSVLLHAAALSLTLAAPAWQAREEARPRLDVVLTSPQNPAQAAQPPRQETRPKAAPALPRREGVAELEVPTRHWTRAERDEMDRFLADLAAETRPLPGQALAQRALAMAGSMRMPAPAVDDEAREIERRLIDAAVEPFSLEMYFDALFRKMNRSAAMLSHERRARGAKVAAVRVVLNQDGSLRSFQILRAGDQQAEIEFIQAVVAQAAPFSAFPPDIRGATDALVLLICIRPAAWGNGGGGMFTRMADGQDCR